MRPRPADPSLARSGELEDPFVRRPTAQQRFVGAVDPPPRRILLDLCRRSRSRHFHDPRARSARAVVTAHAGQGGERVDRPLPAVGRRRLDVPGARVGEEPRRIQQRPDREPHERGRTARHRRRRNRLRRTRAPSDHRRSEVLQAQRLVLHLRPGRRCKERLADGAPLEERLRAVRRPHRARARPASGRVGFSTSRIAAPTAASYICSP